MIRFQHHNSTEGKSSARRLMKARILLKANVSDNGEGWSDSQHRLKDSMSPMSLVRNGHDRATHPTGTELRPLHFPPDSSEMN
jgi:hypothetical protein